MLKAPVNKIIEFSVVDGPGNRTAIFLQGCNLRCSYCHNPETINLCNNCGKCVDVCVYNALKISDKNVLWNMKKCVDCGCCTSVCDNYSSPKVRYMSPDELILEIIPAKDFIRGITISGGECTLYPEFLTELFRLAKKQGLSCFIDSNGSYDFKINSELVSLTDGIMLDVKAYRPEEYTTITKSRLINVYENIVYLSEIGKLYEIRTVISSSFFYDAKETLCHIARLIAPYKKVRYRIIKFRKLGVHRSSLANQAEEPTDEYISELVNAIKLEGVKDIVCS